jgi:hypothetical protein
VAELEHALRELPIDWPPTPDIAAAVRARIDAEPARPARRPLLDRLRFGGDPARPLRSRLQAAALTVLILLGVAMAVEPARSAIFEALGLKGAKIERKAPTATPSPMPPNAPLGEGLDLGEPVTLAQASRRAGFKLTVPGAGLGAPDAVFLNTTPAGTNVVSFLYAAREGLPRATETGAGLLISEVRAAFEPVIEKAAGAGTKLERFSIAGDDAVRLSGNPHGFAFMTENGDAVFEEQRLAGDTLLVQHGDLLVRIEGRVSRKRAIEIARGITATSASATG